MTTQLKVTFVKQGGITTSGTAIGRMGAKTLIAYHINSGEYRERWLPAARVVSIDGDRDTLPVYHRPKTKKVVFDTPIPFTWGETHTRQGGETRTLPVEPAGARD